MAQYISHETYLNSSFKMLSLGDTSFSDLASRAGMESSRPAHAQSREGVSSDQLAPAYGGKVESIFDGPPGRRSGGYGAPDSDDDDLDGQEDGYMEDEDMYYGGEEEVEAGWEVQRVGDLRAYGQECRVSELKRLDRQALARIEDAEEEAEELAEEGGGDATRWVEQLQQMAVSREKELERRAEEDMNGLLRRQREEREKKEREERERQDKEHKRRAKLETLCSLTKDGSVPIEKVCSVLEEGQLLPQGAEEQQWVRDAEQLVARAEAVEQQVGVLLQAYQREKAKPGMDGEALRAAANTLNAGVKQVPHWGELKVRMQNAQPWTHCARLNLMHQEIQQAIFWRPPPPAPAPRAPAPQAPALAPAQQGGGASQPASAAPSAVGPQGGGAATGSGAQGWAAKVEGSVMRTQEFMLMQQGGEASTEWDKELIPIYNLVSNDRIQLANAAKELLSKVATCQRQGGLPRALSFLWSLIRFAVSDPKGQLGLLKMKFPFHSHRIDQEDSRKTWDDFQLVWHARVLLTLCSVLPGAFVLPSGASIDAADVVVGALAHYVPLCVPTRVNWLSLAAGEEAAMLDAMEKGQRMDKKFFSVNGRGVNQATIGLRLVATMLFTLASPTQQRFFMQDMQAWVPRGMQGGGRLPWEGEHALYSWILTFIRTLQAKRQSTAAPDNYPQATTLEVYALGVVLGHAVPDESTILTHSINKDIPDTPTSEGEIKRMFADWPKVGTASCLLERYGPKAMLPFFRSVVDVGYVPFLNYLLDPQQFKPPPTKDDVKPSKHWQLVLLRYSFDWLQPPQVVSYCRHPGCHAHATWYPPSSYDSRTKKLGTQPPRPPVLAFCKQHISQSAMDESGGVYLLKQVKDSIKTK